jgi:hypothetical protein
MSSGAPATYLQARHGGTGPRASYPSTAASVLAYFRGFFEIDGAPPYPESGPALAARNGYAEPGEVPLGIVAPHIDFRQGQRAYAHAFEPWFHFPPADTYLILGVGHRARRQEWGLDRRGYQTCFGTIENDAQAVERIAGDFSPSLLAEPKAHEGEHSIEFSLVWLQALHMMREPGPRQSSDPPPAGRSFRFVPLLCGGLDAYLHGARPHPDDDVHRLARAIRHWYEETTAAGKSVRIIISIDGCHIGPRFEHAFPVDDLVLLDTRLWEEALWSHVEAGALDAFAQWLRREGNRRHFDGAGALGLVMAMFGDRLRIRRRHYEQWWSEYDQSVVTFSSGTAHLAPALDPR